MLRAEGRAYSYIADKLHISKDLYEVGERTRSRYSTTAEREELNTLYDAYHEERS